jgi:hypothetical protein
MVGEIMAGIKYEKLCILDYDMAIFCPRQFSH